MFDTSDQPVLDLLNRYKRLIGGILVVVLVAAGTGWFILRSKSLKEEHALEAYRSAMQSVYQGNTPLAQSDLQKLSVRYSGTVGGTQGAMQLGKLYYDEGKYEEGIKALQAIEPVEDMQYDYHSLIAAGYEGLGQFEKAAQEHEAAAKTARFDTERDIAKANAARDYQAGNKKEQALAIWKSLADNPQSPSAAEARVRIGELEATAVNAAPATAQANTAG